MTKSTKSTLSVILTFSLCLITSTSTLHTALSPFDQQSYDSTPTLSPENLEQQQKEKKRRKDKKQRNKKNQKTKAKKEQSNQNPAIINIPTDGQRDPTNLATWHRKKEKEYQQGLRQVKLSNELIEQSRGQGPEYDSVFREKLLDIYFPESDEDTQPGSPQRESGQPDDPPLGENDQLLFPEPNHESQEAQKLWQKKQLDEITAEADEFLENFSTTPPSLQEQPECPPRYRSDTKQKNPSKSAPPYTGTQQYLEDPHFWTPDMVNWVKNSIHSSSSTGTVQQPASSTSQISCYSCKKKKLIADVENVKTLIIVLQNAKNMIGLYIN